MRYLHTTLRITDLDDLLDFFSATNSSVSWSRITRAGSRKSCGVPVLKTARAIGPALNHIHC